jgi:hypothetical protein
MQTALEQLRFSVVMGLRKGLRLVRGMRRALTEDEQYKIGEAIVDGCNARTGRSSADRQRRRTDSS